MKLGEVQERRDADAGKIRKIFFKTDEKRMGEKIMKKNILNEIISIAVIATMLFTSTVFASATETNTKEKTEDIQINQRIEKLMAGEICPVNEDPHTTIKVNIGDEAVTFSSNSLKRIPQKENAVKQDFQLAGKDAISDIVKLDTEKEEYLATLIVKDTYEVSSGNSQSVGRATNTRSDTDTLSDIQMY